MRVVLRYRMLVTILLGSLPLLRVDSIAAQSLTTGALKGAVYSDRGEPLGGAAVTIEDRGGGTVRELTARNDGSFSLRMLLPGTYNVLVEVEGYQPVRLRGVLVTSGSTTSVSAELVERPPPIMSVTDIDQTGTAAGQAGRVVLGSDLHTLEYRQEGTDFSRDMSRVVAPVDGRSGFALAAGGVLGRMTRVYEDGVPEILLRHPAFAGEPLSLTGLQRDAIAQAQVSNAGFDAEWRGNAGSVVSLITRAGSDRLEFAPYVAGSSAKLGGNPALNPADSAGTSLLGGFTLGGPIKRDTAQFFLQGGYQSLETPSPYPWIEPAGATEATPLRDGVRQVAQDHYGTDVSGSVLPAVRTWKGGAGLGGIDWQAGGSSHLSIRAGGGTFKEENPLLGNDVGNDAGASLSGRDLSAAASLTTVAKVANELRVGLSMARRDWRAAGLPETRLTDLGARFGGNAALPGLFESQLLSLSDAIQFEHNSHALKAGLTLDFRTYKQTYLYGSAGRFVFGGLDQFDGGTGAFFRASAGIVDAKVSAPEIGFFVQDDWVISPGFNLLLGLRYDTQVLPKNLLVAPGQWRNLSAIQSDSLLKDRKGIEPRAGFRLTPGSDGTVLIQGNVGLYASSLELSQFAEAMINSAQNVRVTRTAGAVTWPSPSSGSGATRLTFFGGPGKYRAPRSLKGDLSIVKSFPGGLSLTLAGSYQHTDFLLRRADANLAPSAFGAAQDGRPVWGPLAQYGSLVTAMPGRNRRFDTFDIVSVFSPSGFSDYYEASIGLHRPVGRSFSFSVDYTFSRTRDNLVGLLEADPADQLSPFPGGINGQDWDEGRSDLDVPHRVSAALEFRSSGSRPIAVALRGRYRSGLPFTPGFRSGVDVNGDLGGNNDPVAIDAVQNPSGSGVYASCDRTGVGGFAARNSCRASGVGSLDARVAIPVPFGNGPGRLMLTLEGFNLVASTTGVVDRAALLIDPSGTLSNDLSTGAVQIPYASNPQFGTLLRRGGEPRVVRFGLRVEY